MKRINSLSKKTLILILVAVLVVVAGVVAYVKLSSTPTTDTAYNLTHTAADAEYILSWDSIVSLCPDIGDFDKMEFFVYRGGPTESTPGEPGSLPEDSPAAWVSMRGVNTNITGNSSRAFGVYIFYFDTDEYLDENIELTKTSGIPLQEEGDYWTAVLESGPQTQTQSVQLHLAGNQFYVLLVDVASSDKTLFFGKVKLMELISTVKSNIASLEITPLPSEIPERELTEEPPYEWHEFMTFRSEEISPPIQVPEGQHYNDLIFSERPLMQTFNFTMDKDWRFVITATGEIDTNYEVYITVTTTGEQEKSYSSDHPFLLYDETVTATREELLVEGYEPPVSVEIKVYFDSPLAWVMTIEK